MRKIFVTLSALSLAIVTLLPTIACSNHFDDPNVYRITIVTDAHTINDRSFNEASYNAAHLFQKQFNQWVKSPNVSSEYKNKRVAISWDNPGLTTLDSLLTSYNKAVFIHSNVVIASGFLHHDALVKAQNETLKNQPVKFIFVDGDTPTSEVPQVNKKLAGLQYKAEQSGFLAGLAGAIWLTANNANYGGLNNLKMSTYGGVDIAGVTNYMYGFYWAIKLFNDHKHQINNYLMKLVKTLNPNFINPVLPTIKFVSVNEQNNQFSGNFTAGDQNSKSINKVLVKAGANIIFPVAGPQTEDTLSALQNSKGKIIGVDTNQQEQYQQSADRFITSAQKDLVNSVNFMLWKAVGRYDINPQDLNDKTTHPKDATADNFFTKDPVKGTFYGGSGFTGIAPNDAIKDIYNPLMALGKIPDPNNLLNQVSIGWQKVLSLKKDFWKNGIMEKYNPFT